MDDFTILILFISFVSCVILYRLNKLKQKTPDELLEKATREIQVVSLSAGDVIVLNYPGRLSALAHDNLRKSMEKIRAPLGDVKCVILEEGASLEAVLKPSDDYQWCFQSKPEGPQNETI